MQGKSDVEIKTVRLKTKSDIPHIMADMPEGTDVVTLGRTDQQSTFVHEIWHSARYVDLNER